MEAAGVDEYFKDFGVAVREEPAEWEEDIRGLSLKSGLRNREEVGFLLGSAGLEARSGGLSWP